MLKTRPGTGRAAPVATVKTEFGSGVAALPCQRCLRKQGTNGIPCTNIAGWIGAGGFANRRLVYKDHFRELLCTQQPVVQARRFSGFAKVAQQGRRKNILHQGRLARATHASDAHQPLQRKCQVDVFQVMRPRAFQNQARGAAHHRPFDTHADLLASAQIGTGQRVGAAQIIRRAVKDNTAAFVTRPWPHVDHPVSCQHHCRVMLHHHQGVACIHQPPHGLGDAVHIARMQADGGLVQHKQRVDQRCTQSRCQIDALHFTTRQSAALPIQRQVANSDIAQVFEPGVDFTQQGFDRFGFTCERQRLAFNCMGMRCKKRMQPGNGQLHHIVQIQTRQGFELRLAPLHTHGHEALGRRQHVIGSGFTAHAPQQRLQGQACATAGVTRGVAAVFGQQHPDVHFVGFAFQISKKALDAEPVLAPLTIPVGRAVNHPGLLRRSQLAPGRIARNASGFGMAEQVVLRFFPCRSLQGFDSAGAQSQLVIRNHQAIVHPNHPAKTLAHRTSAHG